MAVFAFFGSSSMGQMTGNGDRTAAEKRQDVAHPMHIHSSRQARIVLRAIRLISCHRKKE